MFIGIFDRPQRASPATPVARAPVPVCTVSLLVVCFTASSDAVRRVSLDGRGDAATVQLAVRWIMRELALQSKPRGSAADARAVVDHIIAICGAAVPPSALGDDGWSELDGAVRAWRAPFCDQGSGITAPRPRTSSSYCGPGIIEDGRRPHLSS